MTCSSHLAQTRRALSFHQQNIENRSIPSFWMFLQLLDPITACDDLTKSCGSKAAALFCIRTMQVRWCYDLDLKSISFADFTGFAEKQGTPTWKHKLRGNADWPWIQRVWQRHYKDMSEAKCSWSLWHQSHLSRWGSPWSTRVRWGAQRANSHCNLCEFEDIPSIFLPICRRSPFWRRFIFSSFPGNFNAVCFCIATSNNYF